MGDTLTITEELWDSLTPEQRLIALNIQIVDDVPDFDASDQPPENVQALHDALDVFFDRYEETATELLAGSRLKEHQKEILEVLGFLPDNWRDYL